MPVVSDSPTLLQRGLGLLILLQAVAVLLANSAEFLHSRQPHGPITTAAEKYLTLTGQPQWWGMFEQGTMRNSVAWDIRIELDAERVARVQGIAGLPDDVWYWNPPALLSRRFVYESSLLGIDLIQPDAILDNAALQMDVVRRDRVILQEFFQSVYRRERRPDWPPEPISMELAILRAPIDDGSPDFDATPRVRYVARWRPGHPLEAYDRSMPGEPWRPVLP